MINLSIAVMHCPISARRRFNVERFIFEFGVHNIQHKVVDFQVFSDWYEKGAWWNARRCWIWGLSTKSTHHLVIQDDIQICGNFVDTLKLCIETYPDNPLGLYANRKVCEEAKKKDLRWCQIPDGVWGQAIVLPHSLIADFLTWEKKHIRPDFKHDDSRLAMYLVEKKIPAMCPMPSLVEHTGARHSIVGQSNKNKVARWFVEKKDYLEYNWGQKDFVKSPSMLSKEYYKYYVRS